MMTAALQVAGGVGSCPAPLNHLPAGGRPQRRQAVAALHALPDPARAVASAAVTEEEEGKVRLGGSGVAVTKLGIGAWSWGDTTYWNDSEWDERRLKEAQAAFDASIDNGMTFFDTAEVYGTALMGAVNSESLLGDFIKERQRKDQVEVAVATKFAALPWRFGRGSVLSALKKSLDRLGLSSVELYQLHWRANRAILIQRRRCVPRIRSTREPGAEESEARTRETIEVGPTQTRNAFLIWFLPLSLFPVCHSLSSSLSSPANRAANRRRG